MLTPRGRHIRRSLMNRDVTTRALSTDDDVRLRSDRVCFALLVSATLCPVPWMSLILHIAAFAHHYRPQIYLRHLQKHYNRYCANAACPPSHFSTRAHSHENPLELPRHVGGAPCKSPSTCCGCIERLFRRLSSAGLGLLTWIVPAHLVSAMQLYAQRCHSSGCSSKSDPSMSPPPFRQVLTRVAMP